MKLLDKYFWPTLLVVSLFMVLLGVLGLFFTAGS